MSAEQMRPLQVDLSLGEANEIGISRVVRMAIEQPVILTKHGKPIAAVISIEKWKFLRNLEIALTSEMQLAALAAAVRASK